MVRCGNSNGGDLIAPTALSFNITNMQDGLRCSALKLDLNTKLLAVRQYSSTHNIYSNTD